MTVENISKVSIPPRTKAEIGVAGLKTSYGYVFEEFLPQLRGEQGRKVFQEMATNDSTVGSLLFAIGLIIRAVDWQTVPAKLPNQTGTSADPAAKKEADFADSLLYDMSHSWEDFISEALTMLVFGWSYFEIVYKRRVGPLETNSGKYSKFDDGLIGVRKLAPRAQDTLVRWDLEEDGGIDGMYQGSPSGGAIKFLPIERCLLFRTVSRKNSPEGISILRTAYKSWYDLKNIEMYEAIGVERELTGLPVVSIPAELLTSTDPLDVAIKNKYEQIARDIKMNEQAGIVIPSDCWANEDGTLSSVPKVQIKLLTSGGVRAINTDIVIQRKQRAIARSCLADFVMLGEGSGTSRGGFRMHESKVNLFVRACESILRQFAYPLNYYMLPRIWKLNGKDPALMPNYSPGKLVKATLEELGIYLKDMTVSGATLFPDKELEDYLRNEADLPPKSEEAEAEQEEIRQNQLDLEQNRGNSEQIAQNTDQNE